MPVLIGQVSEELLLGNPRTAHQRLQAAELLQCFLYRGIHLGGIAHIGVQSHKAPARVQRLCLLHNIQGSIFAAVPGKGNIVARRGQTPNGGGTNAAAAAGNQYMVIHGGSPQFCSGAACQARFSAFSFSRLARSPAKKLL